MQGLTEGRIVHYVAYNDRHLAAIVTGVNPDKPQANLCVFTDMANIMGDLTGGVQFHFHVPFSETPNPGTFHWPERV